MYCTVNVCKYKWSYELPITPLSLGIRGSTARCEHLGLLKVRLMCMSADGRGANM